MSFFQYTIARGHRMPRSEDDNNLPPAQKYLVFKAAYSKLNEYVENNEFLAAHVIAFSILEDRVLATRIQCDELVNGALDKKIVKNKIPFEKSVKKLLELEVIDSTLHDSLLACGHDRNEFLHQAMWRLADFNKKSVLNLRANINAIEKMRRKFIREKK
jgi:hypothetical protein